MLTGKYIGRNHVLFKKTALIIRHPTLARHVAAQFDDLTLPRALTHGWRTFPASHFIIKETNNV